MKLQIPQKIQLQTNHPFFLLYFTFFEMMDMDAIITAAGKNSRMIEDFNKMGKKPVHKLKLEINNKALLVHTIEQILESDIENIILCLGHFKEDIYSILDEYSLTNKVTINVNENPNVGLSKTIYNALKNKPDNFYLFAAGDQPTLTSNTINRMINTLKNSPNPYNTVSILRRRKIGKLSSAEGLGMPFCCYGNLLLNYIKNEDDNLNPILRKMIANDVEFYALKEYNNLELMNVNHYSDYLEIKKEIEKN
jgi:molybdenum cofactor cytidylyltransferase